MSDLNSSAYNYLAYYCDKQFTPNFAVLVEGDWGAGKTHVIRDFFNGISYPNNPDSVSFIEISLFGMSKKQHIQDAIFQKLHPILGSAPVKFASDILSGNR